MKFFKVNPPFYYALIAARNEEKCMDLYEQVVTDIEDRNEFVKYLKVIDRNEAIEKNVRTVSEDTLEPIGLEQSTNDIFEMILREKACVLAIDSALG